LRCQQTVGENANTKPLLSTSETYIKHLHLLESAAPYPCSVWQCCTATSDETRHMNALASISTLLLFENYRLKWHHRNVTRLQKN